MYIKMCPAVELATVVAAFVHLARAALPRAEWKVALLRCTVVHMPAFERAPSLPAILLNDFGFICFGLFVVTFIDCLVS